MYREVEESLTSCELVQALCLNIPPHKQQNRSIFDLEEEEVENLPIHDQLDLQGIFLHSFISDATSPKVCKGIKLNVYIIWKDLPTYLIFKCFFSVFLFITVC